MLHVVCIRIGRAIGLAGLKIRVYGPLIPQFMKNRHVGWKNPKSKLRYLKAMPE